MQSFLTGSVGAVASIGLMLYSGPAPAAASPEPPPDAILAELPFERPGEPNRIYVNLAPEGSRPIVWLLDTGASFSVMTPGVARASGVSVRRTKSSEYRRTTRLGRDIQFVVDTSTSDSGSRTGFEYGLLGGNFLEEYVVELDFEGRRVRFIDADEFRVPEAVDAPDEAVIPMKLPSRRPFVDMELNGKTLNVLLDTGAPGTLTISGSAAKRVGIDPDALPSFGEVGTTMGPMKVNQTETDRFFFAGFEHATLPILVAPRGWYNIGGSNDSAIGYDIISQFTVRLDYPRKRIWLRRNRCDATYMGVPYASTKAAGLYLSPAEDAYYVLGVVADSPASRLGFQSGDFLRGPGSGETGDIVSILARVANEQPVAVTRVAVDEVDRVLLSVEPDPEVVAAQGERDAATIAKEDAERLDAFTKKRAERLYMKQAGRWIVIEGHRRRQGPQEGEEWVTFDEMQRLKGASQ